MAAASETVVRVGMFHIKIMLHL